LQELELIVELQNRNLLTKDLEYISELVSQLGFLQSMFYILKQDITDIEAYYVSDKDIIAWLRLQYGIIYLNT
jgi:hypothetical protein